MKRLLTIVLILALLMPAAAMAVTVSDWMVEGNWMGFWEEDNGARSMICIVLEENNVAYYVAQFFHADEPGLGRAYIGSWDLSDDIVHVKIGENTSLDLKFINGSTMRDATTGRYFLLAELR